MRAFVSFMLIVLAIIVPTATPASVSVSASSGQCHYIATFVADVTLPDEVRVHPNTWVTKIWRVRNDGDCSWGRGYQLHAIEWVGGNWSLTRPRRVELEGEIAPGATAEIRVRMITPKRRGVYTSRWMFHVDDDGTGHSAWLGVGASHTVPLFARVRV